MKHMEYVTLNNGVKMPMVGLGTHMIPLNQMSKVIATAYEVGYRKIDTAWLYGNEETIGNALKENNIPREEMFITSNYGHEGCPHEWYDLEYKFIVSQSKK